MEAPVPRHPTHQPPPPRAPPPPPPAQGGVAPPPPPGARAPPPTTAIWQTVLADAAARGDAAALVDGITGQTISYAQLAHLVERMAAGFAEIGVQPGDVVALHSPNTVLYPVVLYGASRAGATVTTLSALTTAKDMAGQLADSGATLVVTVGALLPVALEAAGERPVWTCDRVEGHPSVQDLLAADGLLPDVAGAPAEEVAVLPHSPGGAPRTM